MYYVISNYVFMWWGLEGGEGWGENIVNKSKVICYKWKVGFLIIIGKFYVFFINCDIYGEKEWCFFF